MVAPTVIDGPINGLAFQAYVDEVLVPELRPGDVVVMDNLGSHNGAGVRAAVEATGATPIYLPPCSPDCNPIETAFAELKAALHEAAERSIHGLCNTIGHSSTDSVPPSAPTTSPPQFLIQTDRISI